MTVDRTALRRLSEGITPLGCPPRMDVACRLAAAVPSLLDALDDDLSDLWLRLHIATEKNVGDRKRIAELEAELRRWESPCVDVDAEDEPW